MKSIYKLRLLSLLCSLITVQLSFCQQSSYPQVVQTKAGPISGSTNANDVHIYKGVPFAAPPIGDLRWKEPQPVPSWTGVRKCDTFSASAMQKPPLPFRMWVKEFQAPLQPLSEDCLYLNVWTAAKQPTEKRPVIVWIHGGAFTGGSGSVPLYDGEQLAKKGVVFVTINYRLGIFGFLALPELTAKSPHHASGNYGLLDQVAALQWVKNNIAAFGGDPNNVTIAGQSAGSFAVNALVASPLTKGLFKRAIAQSGSMLNGRDNAVLKDAEQQGLKIMKERNAASLAALRALPAEVLLQGSQMASPVIDGYVLPEQVLNIFTSSKHNIVPLLTGFNADEGFAADNLMTAEAFKADAVKKYGSLSGAFLKAFPADNDEQAARSQKALSRDLSFGWPNYTWARTQSSSGSPVYFYYFSHVPPGEPNYGAFHSAEFGYALSTLNKWDRPFTPYDRQLSNIMSSYWVNFATTGDPNGNGLPTWPGFTVKSTKVIEFGDAVKAVDLPISAEVKFLDEWSKTKK